MSATASLTPRPGPRPSRSRQEIVECAIQMLNREGPEALTFRAVARELGIAVGALSRYFKSLADLEDEVAARIMSELRPLSATSKLSLRDQLERFGRQLLDINRAHPYLLQIQGPATARMIGRHTRQSLNAFREAGLEMDRAMAIYSTVANLAYAWGAQSASQKDPELTARIAQAYSEELGEHFASLEKMFDSTTAVYRRWLLLCIDGMLATPSVA